MRILHVSDCYLPRLGGIEVQVADLVSMQREAGHTVEVATATRGDELPLVHRIVARMPFDLPVHPRGVGRLTRLMTSGRPDVVHVHAGAVSPFAWMGVRAAVRAGLPVVVTVHSMWDPFTRALYTALRLGFEWHTWGLVATAVSSAAAVPIRAVAGRGTPVHVVSNGLDISAWRPSPGESAMSGAAYGDEVHLVAVGRLAPRKQPVRLLRLLHAVRARVPSAVPLRATIIGDGPARGSMERFLAANGMTSWVSLPGRRTREEIAKVLSSGDVFIAPAPRESFGIAALEARAAGLPVVARSQSGVADFVRHGKEGLLGRSFDDLVAAVVRLSTDTSLRESITEHNRSTPPAAGSWPLILEGFDRCYAEARELAARRWTAAR
ncbi:glycosyltransferase family 1 protein [Nonomuraea africana]|uniref:Glycosyltransferase involved in cell wall biosynthesis n=1 Tax=Nonomuraea africana TaxID=46171 RepID=A0ABR9KL20_9ACTN|nr:glycosyltransferase family 4 protein [Nonomuraea africana]MBE1562713.1 glycosyltransferase involved in cell wall biosynthesis [Nonomuraea africana]